MTDQIKQKTSKYYCCENCDYVTSRKSNLNAHVNSAKHLILTDTDPTTSKIYKCNCGKIYKHKQSLFTHKKKCNNMQPHIEIKENVDNHLDNNIISMFMEVIKQNSEFKELLVEQNKYIMEQNKQTNELTKKVIELSKEKTITTNTNYNNNNKIFNLQMFLNETCKDAMNMSDFLNQLQLTIKDLELTGQDGFAVGIGHSFVQGIKALEVHKRPLHCSDLKRETFYIKEDNIWQKEDETRGKLTKAIQKIAHKNILNIPAWKAEHPYCRDQHHKDNDKFLQIMIESMTEKDDPNIMQEYDKIIRNVAKEVFIDKH